MLEIRTQRAKSFGKCRSCGEQWRTDEKILVVVNLDTDKPVRGEKYCVRCKDMAELNNDTGCDDDGESHLRSMEDFAAYRAAGCVNAYWDDRNAGYAD